jgi:hypothetical protein
MPRYFFHYRTDDELIRDQHGAEFSDLEAAEHNAAELGRAIVDKAAGVGEDTRLPRSIEITDSAGRDLLYVVFWAGPRIGSTGGTPVNAARLH